MKIQIIPILLILSISLAHGQDFSGELTYRTSIIPNEGVTLDSTVLKTDGRISKYLIKSGNYKSSYLDDGQESYSYTYNNLSKRMYDYSLGKEYVTYRDSRIANSTYHNTKVIRDSIDYILGFRCYQVQREADYGFVKTYYSDSIRVDYESFKEHAVGNWYEKLKQVDGAITIKSITQYPDYVEVREAINIEQREVKDVEFKLPEIPFVASFQSLNARVQLAPMDQSQVDCYQKTVKKASKIKGRTKAHTTYLSFVVTESGEIRFIKVYNPDNFGLGEAAKRIINECNIKFIPGKIGNVNVASEVFFPIEFNLD